MKLNSTLLFLKGSIMALVLLLISHNLNAADHNIHKFKIENKSAKINASVNYLIQEDSLKKSKAPDTVKIKISGKVKNELDVGMAKVTVKETDGNNVTITDSEGRFEIQVSPRGALQFSSVGFETQIVNVENRLSIDIALKAIEGSLDEVQVVGFGKQKKVSVVGAIESVKPETLRIPTANLSNALGGRLSGIIAVQRSGQPGADGASFFIRGISTFSGATNPLILLDGVAISQGDFNALAPETIESVSVLKDATATAIYGTRGANGVLIVTTKQGKDLDKPSINIRVQTQMSSPTTIPKFVNGVEYMQLFNEAVLSRGTGEIPYSQDKIDGTRENRNPYLYPNVNWYNELFKRQTLNHEANVNIQGGGKKVGYFMSVTANQSNGLLKSFNVNSYDNNLKITRYSFQNNINSQLTPSTKLDLKLNTALIDTHGPSTDAAGTFGNVVNANPVDFPIMFPFEGEVDRRNLLYGGKSGGTVNEGFTNPFAQMVNGYNNSFSSMVLATIDFEQKLEFLTKGLSFKLLGSFKNFSNTSVTRSSGFNQYQVQSFDPTTLEYQLEMIGQPQALQLGTATGTSGDRSIYFQPYLDYNRTFGKHTISGLALYNQTDFNVNNPSDLITSLPTRRQGFAGRTTYSYDNKYFTEFNFGYNGSENFAEGNRFGFFPSVAVGYVVSNEDFFSNLGDVINLFKIRASLGKVGNDVIGGNRFPYLSNVNLGGASFTTGIDQNTSYSGPVYVQFANNNITWETALKGNLGIDVGLFNNVNFVLDIFKEVRKDIFVDLSSTIPNAFGTAETSVFGNLGEVHNHGFDASLEYSKSFNKKFDLNLRGTFTFARNKVIKNNEPPFTKYKNLTAIGYPIGTLIGYNAERLFIDDAEVANSASQQLGGFISAGDIKYTDVTNSIDGLNIINGDDRVRMGLPPTPEILYGLSTTMRYKKLDISFLLQGVARTSFFVGGFHPFGTQGLRNVMQFIADERWSPDNPNIYATYPRLSKMDNANNNQNSSYWLRDGSFLKLRSAEIGYTTKLGRVFVSGFNLLTFSAFKLWDPEQGGGNGLGYPTQRVFNFGIQMRFN